jgi:hypothetical protein
VLSADGISLYVPDVSNSLLYAVGTSGLQATAQIALRGAIFTATLSGGSNLLFVPNSSQSGLVPVNTSTLAVGAPIGVAYGPSAATASSGAGNMVFVAGFSSNNVSAVSPSLNRVDNTFTVGNFSSSVSGDNPAAVVAAPNGQELYVVGSYEQDGFAEIDVPTGQLHAVPCQFIICSLSYVAVSPDSGTVYMAGFSDAGEGGGPPFFQAVDAATLTIIKSQVVRAIGPLAAEPNGAFVFMSNFSEIEVYNTSKNQFIGSIAAGGVGAMGFSPAGATLYAAAGSSIYVIDTLTQTITNTISLGTSAAKTLSVSPDGSQLWIAIQGAASVDVISTSTFAIQTLNIGAQVSGVAFGVTEAGGN